MPFLVDQPARRLVSSALVVDVDHVDVGMVDLNAEHDDRDVGLRCEVIQLGGRQVNRHHNHAVDAVPQHDLAKMLLVLVDVVAVRDHDFIIVLARDVLNSACHRVIKAVRQVGDQHADGLGPTGAQAARHHIRAITQFLNGSQDALAGLLADLRRRFGPVDHAGDGGLRYACQSGDVVHGWLLTLRGALIWHS